jgi:hypothetical protein
MSVIIMSIIIMSVIIMQIRYVTFVIGCIFLKNTQFDIPTVVLF